MARATVTDVKIRFTGSKPDKPNSFCIFFGAKNKNYVPFKLKESCAGRYYLIATCDGGLDEKFKTKSMEFDISRITIYGTEDDIHFQVVEEASQTQLTPGPYIHFNTGKLYFRNGETMEFTPFGEIADMTPAPFGTDFNKWPIENPAITKKKLEETTMTRKKSLSIKNIVFNGPATIIFWDDNTKTIVKCGEGDVFDPEKGVAMAVMKRALGTNDSDSNYLDKVRKYLDQYREKEQLDITPQDILTCVSNAIDTANEVLTGKVKDIRIRRLKQEAMDVRTKMVTSGATNWELETFDRFCRKYITEESGSENNKNAKKE